MGQGAKSRALRFVELLAGVVAAAASVRCVTVGRELAYGGWVPLKRVVSRHVEIPQVRLPMREDRSALTVCGELGKRPTAYSTSRIDYFQ